MSRKEMPKQLLPIIGGRSLLQIAYERLDSLIPPENRLICAGRIHREIILSTLADVSEAQFIGEPVGRDTLSALALSAAIIVKRDPEAVICVFTADHIIKPEEDFRDTVDRACKVVETTSDVLMTYGITPTEPSTGYGYLQLGKQFRDSSWVVEEFKEKPDIAKARVYVAEGPQKYLWNSGMFVWKARVFLHCVRTYEPEVYSGVTSIAEAWETNGAIIDSVYPELKKISVDFAIMEPASRDRAITVAALPMQLDWLDIGSWPAYGKSLAADARGNMVAAEKSILLDCNDTVIASDDPNHLVAAIGCDEMVIIHTGNSTLVCPKKDAEKIKNLHEMVSKKFGSDFF